MPRLSELRGIFFMLFDAEVQSIGDRPKYYAEPTFTYYNQSARADVVKIKTVLEAWFARFPVPGQTDLRQRFRSNSDRQHYGAFFELYLHEFLLRSDYSVEVHPDVEQATHPDFLVSRAGIRRFYVEATIGAESDEKVAQQRRMDQVYDSLNRLRSPDFFLALRVRGAPETPPPGARLRRELEGWLRTLNWTDIQQRWDAGGFDALPIYPWEHEGWSVLVQPIPKSEANRGSEDLRPIGLNMPLMMMRLAPEEDVKKAVQVKNKYGNLDLPFVVALNIVSEFCAEYDVMNGLFGHETVIFGPTGTRPGERLHDGAWDGPRGPQNTTVSAVMVYRELKPWSMKDISPWFIHNPWATRPLPPESLPCTQFVPDHQQGKLVKRDGTNPGVLLGLPEPWPPEE